MKTIYLMRHGDAAPSSGHDSGRPLTEAGQDQARRAAAWLAGREKAPQAGLYSPARRTEETMLAVKNTIADIRPVRVRGLYNATAEQIFDVLKKTDNELESVVVVGHNPGISMVGMVLAGSGNPEALEALRAGFSPAMIVAMECPVDDWSLLKKDVSSAVDVFAA
jgi:phosphohistidine phosphatase